VGALKARLASGNRHKLEELRAALPTWELDLLDADYPDETGATYLDNARSKALLGRTLARDGWVLGEDSGVEVAALGGEPGVRSARWSGGQDPVTALLGRLGDAQDRRARYVCHLVAIGPGGEEHVGVGILEGRIAESPAGSEGFGYDPIFVPEQEQRTVAELGDAWKRLHSHRARAARALAERVAEP
jgi:XTP/dITP diphosphohydrolase